MKSIRAHVVIEGLVQGVFFRDNTRETASSNGISGWVRNNPDGTVEAIFEGEEEAVKKTVEWCRKGPNGARVERVDVRWDEFMGEFYGFDIIRRR
ncbi:MAG: acylphosphatase [Thermodesulfobacteriota bacterium]